MTAGPAGKKRVEVLKKETPHRGYFRIDTYHLRHCKFDGGWTEPMSREVFERGHAAAVLPYDPDRDAVVLIEQFRIGGFAAGVEPWLVEVVAGIIDKEEDRRKWSAARPWKKPAARSRRWSRSAPFS